MANVTEGAENFILGLSDLWTRFFKDRPQLEGIYKGTEILIGQAYLDLLTNVLNLSLRETPVFRKEFFKLLTVREDLVEQRLSDGRYTFELTDFAVKGLKNLQNKIFQPTTILEEFLDYEVEIDGEKDLLVFYKNPFDWTGSNDTIPGVAYRTVTVVADDGTESQQRELAFWLPDVLVDRFDLYLSYGYLLDRFEPSSEAYRALLQGIVQYFVLGPTIQHLTSALNVIIGLPVVRDDGEILQEVDSSDARYNVVKTDRANYQFDAAIPLREDVLDEDNWGTLIFQAFEHLSDVFQVKDSVSDPTWWFDITIPQRVMPDEGRQRRMLNPVMYENQINNPPGLVKIGDPGFFIGADDDGFVPTTPRPTYRHLFSYIVFERFLKHHSFIVEFNPDVLKSDVIPFPRLDLDIQNVILAGRSAYTLLYLEPGITFTDTLKVAPDSAVLIFVQSNPDDELVWAVDSSLVIGDHSWKIGDYYVYTPSGVEVKNESTDPIGTRFQDGKTPVAIGGAEPTPRNSVIISSGVGDATFDYDVPLAVSYMLISNWDKIFYADVGRYIYRPAHDIFYEITAVMHTTFWTSDITLVAFENSGVIPAGTNENWELRHGPANINMLDWPVQIEVI